MVKATYYCDGCGVEKKESNHWIATRTETRDTILPEMRVCAFIDAGPQDSHLCGAGCLVRQLDAFEVLLRAKCAELECAAMTESGFASQDAIETQRPRAGE